MSEFTFGKWKAFDGEKFHVIRQAYVDDVEGHDYGNGKLIAYVVQWHEGHDWANAKLIAAAPELYELARTIASLPDEQCMISPLISEARRLVSMIDGEAS